MPDPTPKKFYLTSEFWFSGLAALLGLLFMSGLVGAGTPLDHFMGIAATTLGAMGYSVSRGLAKGATPAAAVQINPAPAIMIGAPVVAPAPDPAAPLPGS